MYDIIIIGGGVAGLTAALYARRANKEVLVIEKGTFGGQITYSPKVENIPGFLSLTGNEFAEKLVDQVLSQGADTECAAVLKITDGKYKKVLTDDGEEYEGKAVIIATGAKHRVLGVNNEEKFIGDGISFCAVCDGAFYKDKTVAVIGGGNSALQEALLLTDLAKKVYLIQNLDFLTGEEKLAISLEQKENAQIITGAEVSSVLGEESFEGIMLKKKNSDKEEKLSLDGMFVAIGLEPQNEPFSDIVELDKNGYALAGEDCFSKTAGVFAAGDCRRKKIRQVSTAASDGACAAMAAVEYIKENF